MTRINMTKYGFIRWPEEDFSDDGNRFTCFKVGDNLRVSKLVSNGEAFLSASLINPQLTYEEYSNLPNYKKAEWEYNGISLAGLTDEDLQNFYEACVAFEKEYVEAVAALSYPTKEEIADFAREVQVIRKNELETCNLTFNFESLLTLTTWDIEGLTRNYKYLKAAAELDPEEYAQRIYGTLTSRTFVGNEREVAPSSYFLEIARILMNAKRKAQVKK